MIGLDCITELLGFLDSLYGDMVKRYDNMIADVRSRNMVRNSLWAHCFFIMIQGVISYRALWYVFTKGKKVIGKTDTNYSVGAGSSLLPYISADVVIDTFIRGGFIAIPRRHLPQL